MRARAAPGRTTLLRRPRPWTTLFEGPSGQAFESWLETYLAERRWFGQKTRTITSASIVEAVPIPSSPQGYGNGSARDPLAPVATILIVQLEFDQGASERYTLPVAFLDGFDAEEMKKWQPDAVMADLHAQGHDGVLLDATHSPEFVRIMADLLARRRTLPGRHGQIVGIRPPASGATSGICAATSLRRRSRGSSPTRPCCWATRRS